jgi:hypothetical protein
MSIEPEVQSIHLNKVFLKSTAAHAARTARSVDQLGRQDRSDSRGAAALVSATACRDDVQEKPIEGLDIAGLALPDHQWGPGHFGKPHFVSRITGNIGPELRRTELHVACWCRREAASAY